VEDKGWAHAIAHTADAIEELSKRRLAEGDMIALLDAVRDTVCTKAAVYNNLEEERLTTAVLTILRHDALDPGVIRIWLVSFTHWEKTEQWQEEYKIISNAKNFLAALNFRLCAEGSYPELAHAVKQVRLELMKPYI
jgi:hypothetical protein